MDNINQEDLQSRRGFFKSAVKAALPILGAVVLSQVPFTNANAATDCDGSCYVKCNGSCVGQCARNCRGECVGSCLGVCRACCD